MKSKGLYIGTSGWSYKHWNEIFYPADIRPEKYLEFYIQRFICVELNSSFYHLPLKTTVSGWMNRTPDTFRFCLKLSRLITHQLQLANSEEVLQKFFDVFECMKARLGPVLIQVHPGLIFDRSRIVDFLDLIKEKYDSYRFAIEVRNKSWVNDDFYDLLSRYGMAFVIADSGDRYPYSEEITADFVYLRFHGREQLYASDYSEEVLISYASKIYRWLEQGREVWAFFNNDYHGYAPNNAEQLREIVNQQRTQ